MFLAQGFVDVLLSWAQCSSNPQLKTFDLLPHKYVGFPAMRTGGSPREPVGIEPFFKAAEYLLFRFEFCCHEIDECLNPEGGSVTLCVYGVDVSIWALVIV